MASVVFDIETVGIEWETLDDGQRTYLEKNAKTEEERRKLPAMLSLWPFTGRIIAVAMVNSDTGRGRAWYEKTDGRSEETSTDGLFTFIGDAEPASVGPYYRAGRLREIALYCRRDVEATARLFQKLEKTLLPALESRKPA